MIELKHEMDFHLDVEGPLLPAAEEAHGGRQWWEMSSATLEGPRIRASTAMKGIDWFTPGTRGFGRPHVRLPFRTDDGAVVLLEYRGLVQATPAFEHAVANDGTTSWEDQYMRMALSFETESSRYRWMTESLFISRGRLLAAKRIAYEVYRVI